LRQINEDPRAEPDGEVVEAVPVKVTDGRTGLAAARTRSQGCGERPRDVDRSFLVHLQGAVAPRSSYVVLPLFALANAGVVLDFDVLEGRGPLFAAIAAALVLGKPLGMTLFCAAAVWLRLAAKPAEYSWRQLVGAGALSGIGFTMSLFIAAEAFPMTADFSAAKMAVFAASFAAAVAGVAILAWPSSAAEQAAAESSAGIRAA
jgi:Na+/H+ antiporter NhaA